jgi:hypothetical protein
VQFDAITAAVQLTVQIFATNLVIDPVAVADIEATLAAVPPDRELHEPGKGLRKLRIERSRVNVVGNALDQVGAAMQSVASRPVGMVSIEPVQDASAMQEIMHERIDNDEPSARLEPHVPPRSSANQQR